MRRHGANMIGDAVTCYFLGRPIENGPKPALRGRRNA